MLISSDTCTICGHKVSAITDQGLADCRVEHDLYCLTRDERQEGTMLSTIEASVVSDAEAN